MKNENDNEARLGSTCDHADDDAEDDEPDRHIPELTMKELMIAINSLKKEKSADSKGVKAEDIKGADEEATNMTHEIFNLINEQNSMAPSLWKKVVIIMFCKKGNATKPENCSPICGLVQRCKLFSTMIYNRLYAELDRYQCSDQGRVFRNKFQTTDHIFDVQGYLFP